MASIRTEFEIDVDAAAVWEVIGDWLNGPARMARGHVLSSLPEGDAVRVVTFADGTVVRERLVTRDDAARRIVYSVTGLDHDNAVMHIVPTGDHSCRFIWSRDVLPDAAAESLDAAMTQAARVIKRTLENPSGDIGDKHPGLAGADAGDPR